MIVLIIVGFGLIIWPTPYRSFTLRAAPRSILAARQFRMTGRVDVLTSRGWHPLVDTTRIDSVAPPLETITTSLMRGRARNPKRYATCAADIMRVGGDTTALRWCDSLR